MFPDFGLEVPQFVENRRGGASLIDSRGNIFVKKDSHKTKTYWRCSHLRKTKCTARVITENFEIVSCKGEHNHGVMGSNADYAQGAGQEYDPQDF